MAEISARNFGLLIAYLIPGFITVFGISFVNDDVNAWLRGAGTEGPSIGAFLSVSLASLAAGMSVSAVRWAVVDTLHNLTGLRRPRWDDRQLPDCMEAMEFLVTNYYRYYEFYSNSAVAIAFAYALWRRSPGGSASPWGWLDAGALILIGIHAAGSRSTLGNYYRRAALLLGTQERLVGDDQRSRFARAQESGVREGNQASRACGATQARRKGQDQAEQEGMIGLA